MAQSEELSLLTMKSRVRIPTELNNTMQYALMPNYARRMALPLMAGNQRTPEEMYAASLRNADRLQRRRKAKAKKREQNHS